MRGWRIAVVALVSVAIVGGTFAVLSTTGSSKGGGKSFSTLSAAPRDVQFLMTINTDPASSQWIETSKRVAALKADKPIKDSINESLQPQGLRWDKDVVSVLGKEAFLAVTDFSSVQQQKGAVAAFDLRDPSRARQNFLKLARDSAQKSDQTLTEEDYHGTTITYAQEKSGVGRNRSTRDFGAIAFPGKMAVLGLSRDDVKGVLDVIQGRAPGISQNDRFQEVRGRQKDDFLVWGYADLSKVWDKLLERGGPLSSAPPQTADAVKQARDSADRVTFSLGARGQGFVVDSQLLRAPNAPADASQALSQAFEPNLARQVPSDTILLISGANTYEQVFKPVQKAAAQDRDFDSSLKQIESEIGFRLDGDLFGLMKSEYGLAANASSQGDFSVLGLFNTQDATRISRSLDQLGRYLSQEAGVTAPTPDRNGVRHLSSSGATVAWKPAGNSIVFGYPDNAVQTFAPPAAGKSLADSADWKQAMSVLPKEKSSLIYVSLARLVQEADDAGLFDSETGPRGINLNGDALKSLRSLAISSTTASDGQSQRMVVLMDR